MNMTKQSMTSRNVDTLVLILSVLLIAVIGVAIWMSATKYSNGSNTPEDACRVSGAVLEDGHCVTRKLSPEAKVCMAMKGSYALGDGKEFKCYSTEGKERIMPNLEGKEVIIIGDTLVLKDKG